ncbi:uncharacterized protein LOC106671916 isoform X2 [Cimex lectularius]|uniref:Chitin-binding type-2 domain-containing protein n=1 Tax=Cimex lectularius TaxID=79782 RepID=A0A8I6S445_CIMLE|nr:uncharacterized protein LOC106671916 isoform X2 [Cimex lectularius]
MYWAHLIFSLVTGLIVNPDCSSATKPGYLDFDNLPETNFSCEGKVIGGYYADVETGCQMFHVCTIGQKGNSEKSEVTDIKFLCLNGTVFDQETRVCERIDEVDCSKSEDFFGLNLELYGNNVGIQPESEFDCDDCSTEEDYDLDVTTTTPKPPTTTTTTTTSTTTTSPPKVRFPASSPETIAALLALHNAFTQSLENSKVKAPPPRLINNAFAQTQNHQYSTQRPVKIRYDYSGLHEPPRQKPFYQPTTPVPTSNYHHFQSSDASFGHSFDLEKPYNFQFFHSRRIEEPVQKAVSVVTSTSTSTSVRTSKNATLDFPTGYDEYQDDLEDPFFRDVPKIRSKRSEDEVRHANHKYDETTHANHKHEDTAYPNHKYDEKSPPTREEFLKNLLGSIDMEENDREKMVSFFIREERQLDKGGGMLHKIGNKLGEAIMEDVKNGMKNDSDTFDLDHLSRMWKNHYEEMSKEVALDFNLGRKKRDAWSSKFDENVTDVEYVENGGPKKQVAIVDRPAKKTRVRQRSGTRTTIPNVKPVFEEVDEGDFTTVPYRRVAQVRRNQRTTLRPEAKSFKFNYETSKNPPEPDSSPRPDQDGVPVYEFDPKTNKNDGKTTRGRTQRPETTTYRPREPPQADFAQTQVPKRTTTRFRGRVRGTLREPVTTTTTIRTIDPSLKPDPDFSCEGKVKGGFYADVVADCRGFFICSQGQINGPLLKSHFWCGATTRFNQRSRTCQADYLVECSLSKRYFHLNDDFLVPETEEDLKGPFEPKKVKNR